MSIKLSFLIFSLISLSPKPATPSPAKTPTFPSLIRRPESPENPKTEIYETKYFTQTLDHFNFLPQSYNTFQQRYLISRRHWTGPTGPIFVYSGNEGDIEWFARNTGFMIENAPRFKALLVFIEHRYYGKSVPFGGDKDVAYANSSTLGYLSSTQALADYATLIINLKENLTAVDSPVVVFGGSYGGMLAAWFRLKYPHVAIGALASSSPILNFENITSPYSFTNIITHDFKSESESCYKVIKGSWGQIDDVASRPGGLQKLRRSFRICRNYISGESLKDWISTALTDYPTVSNFLMPLPAYPVKQMCEAIDDPRTGNDTFAKMYGAVNIYYNYTGDATCFDLDDDSDPHGLGGWSWQARREKPNSTRQADIRLLLVSPWTEACTEMVMAESGSNKDSIFPEHKWSYERRAIACEGAYGIEPRPYWITSQFGGHNIERVLKRFGSNIIFFNGLRDPWSGGGVLRNISETIVAIVEEQGAHHVDLRFSTSEDPKWLQDVRRREVNIIAKWLLDYYHDLSSNDDY